MVRPFKAPSARKAKKQMSSSHASPHDTPAKGASLGEWILGGCGVVGCLLPMSLAGFGFAYFIWGVATRPNAHTPQAPTTVVIGKEWKPYEFDSTGCVEVLLKSQWISHAQGGRINWIDIKTGQILLTESPGEKHKNVSFGDGWYRVCAAEPKATGVDIFQ